MRTYVSLCCSLALTAALGCGSSSPGEEGKIQFTPIDCGRTSCSFEDAIAVGGRLSLHIFGAEGVSTAGVDVRASDTSIMTVEEVPDVGAQATWGLTAIAAGTVDIEVFRAGDTPDDDEVIDKLEINVQAIAKLGLENFIGDAVGPTAGGGFDESWTVNADAPVSFRVTTFVEGDNPAMGLFDYTVTLDAELMENLIDFNLTEGRLYVRPPAGSWSAEWQTGGTTFRAAIIAE